jgi:hypothetical protein
MGLACAAEGRVTASRVVAVEERAVDSNGKYFFIVSSNKKCVQQYIFVNYN